MENKLNIYGLPMVTSLDQVNEIIRKHFRMPAYTVMVEDFTIHNSNTYFNIQFFKNGELYYVEPVTLLSDSLTSMENSLITTLDALERNVLKP